MESPTSTSTSLTGRARYLADLSRHLILFVRSKVLDALRSASCSSPSAVCNASTHTRIATRLGRTQLTRYK
jgi:hypothetical protein